MDQTLKLESKTLRELKSSPVRPAKSSRAGFLLLSDISVMVDRSGTAQVTGNICLRLDTKLPAFNMVDPCPTKFVLLVSSSLNKYHFAGRDAKGESSEMSSVIRLFGVPYGLWYTVSLTLSISDLASGNNTIIW